MVAASAGSGPRPVPPARRPDAPLAAPIDRGPRPGIPHPSRRERSRRAGPIRQGRPWPATRGGRNPVRGRSRPWPGTGDRLGPR
jgi:hypothetical protein